MTLDHPMRVLRLIINEPDMLPNQMCSRLVTSRTNLTLFAVDPDGCLESFLAHDECWVHNFIPETKRIHAVVPSLLTCPKEDQGRFIYRKSMASVFWNAKNIVVIDSLQIVHTLTAENYVNLLGQLHKAINNKRPGK